MTSMTNSAAREELNEMLSFLMEFAQQMLHTQGEFFPFGAGMSPEGEMTSVAADPGDRRPASKDVLALLHSGLTEQAGAGEIKAAGICMDVRVIPPGATDQSDAICIELEHREGESVHVFLPYVLEDSGKVQYGELFATPGEQTIFVPIAG